MLDRASPAHGYEIAIDQRMFHEYGIVVACAHALARGIDVVVWPARQFDWRHDRGPVLKDAFGLLRNYRISFL
ncbi:hypothetical protein P3T23_005703 [Paraburkholderia sp. GAS448]